MEPLATEKLKIHPDTRTLRRRVLNIAWPIIGENFLETFLMVVDTLLVGQLGAAALAGVGTAMQVMYFIIAILSALAVGSSVLIAQAFGAKNLEQASHLARQALIWSLILSIPLVIIGYLFTKPIIGIFNLDAEVTQIGVDYLELTLLTSAVMTASLIGSGILRGVGDSRSPMIIRAIANLVNVVLSYGLIFGRLGLPEIGVMGSAWGTFLARSLGLVMLLYILWQGRHGLSIRGSGTWWPDLRAARQLLRLGIPAALEQVLITAAFFLMTIVVAGLGTNTFAAHRIAIMAMSLSFMPGMGFSLAATALVGQSIGAQRPDEAAIITRISTLWALWWMGAIGTIMFIIPVPILSLFTPDKEVVMIGVGGLRMVALIQPFWAILMVQAGALRGTGDTTFPMWVNTSAVWLATGLAYLFITLINPSLGLVWSGFLISTPPLALLLWRRCSQTMQQRA